MNKMLKRIILLLSLLVSMIATELSGQSIAVDFENTKNAYVDTIRLQMPNSIIIEYGVNYRRDYISKGYKDELKSQKQIKDELDVFLKRWKVLGITNIEDKDPMFIDNSETKISISNRENIAEVEFPKNTKLALTITGKHKLKLALKHSDAFIYFDRIEQLEELKKFDIEQILKEADMALEPEVLDKKKRNKPLNAWLSVNEYNQVGLTYHKFKKIEKPSCYLNLNYSPTLESINGDWLTGIRLGSSIIYNRRGYDFLRLGADYEFQYNFSADRTNIAHWFDTALSINLGEKNTYWLGVSFGFLVKENGDFFDNHKFRIGIPVDLTRHISVTPEIYFEDFFKSSKKEDKYLGVKLAYSF